MSNTLERMMELSNFEIKKALFENNMKQWQLAELLGVSEFTLSRKMRKEFPESAKAKIIELIKGNGQKGSA